MSDKRNFVIGIMDDERIWEVNKILGENAFIAKHSSSHAYFHKQPLDFNKVVLDITFFQLDSDDALKILVKTLDDLDVDYILMDVDSNEIIRFVDFVAKIYVSFDNVKVLKKGTFEKIDKLKHIRTENGYSKGFKPSFRPLDGNSIEGAEVKCEIIYLVSNSPENLSKFSDYVTQNISEIDPDLKVEVMVFDV